ncbi:MAG: phage baseplate assembly protein V [Motilibacteraceae bacterium]
MTVPTAIGTEVADLSPVVKINGAELSLDLVVALQSARVELGLRQVGRVELTFLDEGLALLQKHASLFKLGAELEVAVDAASPVKVFSGLVTGVQVDQHTFSDGLLPYVTLVASDRLHELAFGQQPITKAKVSLANVVKQIASAAGLTAKVSGLPTFQLDQVTITEPPLRYLDRLADLYGVEWWAEDKTLNVAAPDGGGQFSVEVGADVAQLSFETRDTGPGKVTLTGWDPGTKEVLTGTPSTTSVRPVADLAVTDAQESTIDSKRPLAARATRVTEAEDAKAQAQAATDASRRDRTELRLQLHGISPTVKPRTTVKLQGAGPLNGTYPVAAVTHLWDSAGARTRLVAGPRRPTGLASVLAAGAGAAVPAGGLAGVLLVGVVSSLNDPNGWGRVKVKLPTLGGIDVGWARVLLPSGGPDRGLVVPHQVNDEVVVGFEEGDLERPVVLGGVHGGKDKPPAQTKAESGKAEVAGFVTTGKHALLLDDSATQGKNGLRFDHAKKHLVHVTDTGIAITAEQGQPIKLTAGQSSIEMDGKGNVTIKGMKVTIEAQQALEVKGLQVKAEAQTTMQLQAQATAELKANASVTVESSGQTAIKGGIVQIN